MEHFSKKRGDKDTILFLADKEEQRWIIRRPHLLNQSKHSKCT